VDRRADPLAVSSQWCSEDRELWWNWLHGRVSAAIRQRVLGRKGEACHSSVDVALPNYLGKFKLTALLDYRETLLRERRALDGAPNPAATDQERRRMEPIVDALLIPWMYGLEPPDEWRPE
jgi:hypothetical protein